MGLGVDDPAWDHSTFSKNRDRLLDGDIAVKFLSAVLVQPRVKRLLSTEHFSVDGTLIEAWASMKSFRPKERSDEPPSSGGRNAEANFRGETRSNATHASTTDPDARLYRKGAGKEAKLCFMGHALMENRSGLVVSACLTRADGHAEAVSAVDPDRSRQACRVLAPGGCRHSASMFGLAGALNRPSSGDLIAGRLPKEGGALSTRIRHKTTGGVYGLNSRPPFRPALLARSRRFANALCSPGTFLPPLLAISRPCSRTWRQSLAEYSLSQRSSSNPRGRQLWWSVVPTGSLWWRQEHRGDRGNVHDGYQSDDSPSQRKWRVVHEELVTM